ncbi:transcriptional regulator [Dactylosporangium sp. NBC_01737]|uniref:transcriptional regulator n=1 Tax=Dactylosporangium sp. NBC_01737 TaxID=2975959 RepID=UPI002E13EA75|nr:transcriptional regulator [Dactylosporangium sp. NBC_01737]
MLLRLAYLGVTNALAMLRLLPVSDRAKDVEILALRHQVAVLERQLHGEKVRFDPADRAFLAALLHRLPRDVLRRVRLLVRADTVLRWHPRPARPTARSALTTQTRRAATHGPVHPRPGVAPGPGEQHVGVPKDPRRAARPVHQGRRVDRLGDLARCGDRPGPERTSDTWASFLRSQAEAILAMDFFETVTVTGAHLYVLAAIDHATRRVRVLGATARPTAAWVTQAVRNLAMDLQDAGCRTKYLIRDRDGKYPALVDTILADTGIEAVLSGVRMPRMNSVMERWVQTVRRRSG